MITGLHHVNLTVPQGTLDQANIFYGETIGLTARPVPAAQAGTLAWFDLISSSEASSSSCSCPHSHAALQQLHIAYGGPHDNSPEDTDSVRHPCFRVGTPEDLAKLQRRVYAHFLRGGPGAPRAADKPGEANSGEKGPEYPTRFFARDYAGNRIEFSL